MIMKNKGSEIVPINELNIESTIAQNPILNEFSSTFISLIIAELSNNPDTIRITISVTSLSKSENPFKQKTRRVTFQKKVVDGRNRIVVSDTKLQNMASVEKTDIGIPNK